MTRLEISYYPAFRDGAEGHHQLAYVAALEIEALVPYKPGRTSVETARLYLAAKFGPGQDRVVQARWCV